MVLDVFHISTMSEVCITCHSPGVHPTQGLIGVPSVTNHRSMASVPTMYFLSLNNYLSDKYKLLSPLIREHN